jgi:hypothetical protein
MLLHHISIAGIDQTFIFVSLARGEIVKVKAPTAQATNGDLFFDKKSLNCIRSSCILK